MFLDKSLFEGKTPRSTYTLKLLVGQLGDVYIIFPESPEVVVWCLDDTDSHPKWRDDYQTRRLAIREI